MPAIARQARVLQPGIIIVDRAVPGPYQNYLTPENQVPETLLPYPWESCMIMGGGWSYTPGARLLPTRTLVHMLIDIVAKGGNLLLNIGPGPDGTWYDEAYLRLREIGEWLQINGPAIYDTRPLAPYKQGNICFTQGKDGSRYAIYLAAENERRLPSRISIKNWSPVPNTKPTLLGVRQPLAWVKEGNGFAVAIPAALQKKPPSAFAWVIKIPKI
jgi:alpha-L-fucosidase